MVRSAQKDVISQIIKKKERNNDKMERDFSLQKYLMLYGSNG